ncbi:MAG TPA: hypothetical protein VLG41_15330 [Hydrogenophaga sp.]|uniref:hypothetical protein n=1 Tax=Hydrogenophaga sp. TaxID=1904254 RepID=UPI002C4C73D5|nr:hypothetical protein [Hydrogenophaga sp.]HSX94298.1 hypothetical protein [Hydrogenophaga sp.]
MGTRKTGTWLALVFAYQPHFAQAAAPIYFDIGQVVLVLGGSAAAFIALLLGLISSRSNRVKLLCLSGLLAYPAYFLWSSYQTHKIRKPHEGYTHFRGAASTSSAVHSTAFALCNPRKSDVFRIKPILSLRLQPTTAANEPVPRGWQGVQAFVLAGISTPDPVYEPHNEQTSLAKVVRRIGMQRLSEGSKQLPSLEYLEADGTWSRLEPSPDAPIYQVVRHVQPSASHIIQVNAIKTSLEKSADHYGVRIDLIDPQANRSVAWRQFFARDLYDGHHNRWALMPTNTCGFDKKKSHSELQSWLEWLMPPSNG